MMEMENMSSSSPDLRDVVIERVFNARPEVVWKYWTEPELIKKWFGPANFTTPVYDLDLRVGGKILYCMRGPDGKNYWGTGIYREIQPMTKIVATDSFADENGNIVPASYYGMTDEGPTEGLITLRFQESDGMTRFTLVHHAFVAGEQLESAREGWSESFDKLNRVLLEKRSSMMNKTQFIVEPGTQNVVIKRMFEQPPEVVFKTMTDAAMIPDWWGPREYRTVIDRYELKEGGIWRFIQRDKDDKTEGFHGVYHEVTNPTRLIYTFEYEGMPGHVALVT
ncbi:hypothetical protein EG834_14810, partial [bacterium]|nr:hypothetical protein [bacterium]